MRQAQKEHNPKGGPMSAKGPGMPGSLMTTPTRVESRHRSQTRSLQQAGNLGGVLTCFDKMAVEEATPQLYLGIVKQHTGRVGLTRGW